MKNMTLLALFTLLVSGNAFAMTPGAGAGDVCSVKKGPYTMTEADYAAVADSISKADFQKLPDTSKTRAQVCQSRKVSQLITNGEVKAADLSLYPDALPLLMTDDEAGRFSDLQSVAVADALMKKKHSPGRPA